MTLELAVEMRDLGPLKLGARGEIKLGGCLGRVTLAV